MAKRPRKGDLPPGRPPPSSSRPTTPALPAQQAHDQTDPPVDGLPLGHAILHGDLQRIIGMLALLLQLLAEHF